LVRKNTWEVSISSISLTEQTEVSARFGISHPTYLTLGF
jgi:hypothetical protein